MMTSKVQSTYEILVEAGVLGSEDPIEEESEVTHNSHGVTIKSDSERQTIMERYGHSID